MKLNLTNDLSLFLLFMVMGVDADQFLQLMYRLKWLGFKSVIPWFPIS